jgi:hypothetical protein
MCKHWLFDSNHQSDSLAHMKEEEHFSDSEYQDEEGNTKPKVCHVYADIDMLT